MIKKIYQIADVHIPTYQKLNMYAEQLDRLVKQIENDAASNNLSQDEIRIVICGDLVNSKNIVTNELNIFTSAFIRGLSKIGKVICIAGNHDMIEGNTVRIDTLSSLFQTAQFDNAYFLDMSLNYESGVMYDDNITWALYSFFDDFNVPDIQAAREEYPNNTVIGLFHGNIVGTKLYNGFVTDFGIDKASFEGCDCVMAGHIHKRQELRYGDCPIVYSGSVIQKDFGESFTQHGYCMWDLENNTHTFVDLPTEYGYYDFTISSIDDLKDNKEVMNNY